MLSRPHPSHAPDPNDTRDWINTEPARYRLDRPSREAVRDFIRRHKIPTPRMGNRLLIFWPAVVEKYPGLGVTSARQLKGEPR